MSSAINEALQIFSNTNTRRHLSSLSQPLPALFKMLLRIFLVCVGLSVAGSALSCRWMDQKFKQLSENSLDLLEMMVSDLFASGLKSLE